MGKIIQIETPAEKLMHGLSAVERALVQKQARLNSEIRAHNKKGWLQKDIELLANQKDTRKTVEQLLAQARMNIRGFTAIVGSASEVELAHVEESYSRLRTEYMKLP